MATVVDGQENNNQEYTPFIMQGVQLDVQTIFSECIQVIMMMMMIIIIRNFFLLKIDFKIIYPALRDIKNI